MPGDRWHVANASQPECLISSHFFPFLTDALSHEDASKFRLPIRISLRSGTSRLLKGLHLTSSRDSRGSASSGRFDCTTRLK